MVEIVRVITFCVSAGTNDANRLLSSDSLAFATEPVFASLANVLGNHDRLPPNISADIRVSSKLAR